MGRSGTTLLRHCLGAHRCVDLFNHESNYIHDLMCAADNNLEYKNRLSSMPVEETVYWHLHHQLLLNMNWPVEHLRSDDGYKAISTYSMLDPRAAIGLKKTFPKLAICYIIRNGIEVVSSYMSFPAFKHLSFAEACKLWVLRYDMFDFAVTRDHVFLFRFEWLQQQQELFVDQLRKAYLFCGLDYDQQCSRPLSKRFHPTVFQGEPKDVAQDINRRSERWKYWTQAQRDEFAKRCGESMEAMGYDIPWT